MRKVAPALGTMLLGFHRLALFRSVGAPSSRSWTQLTAALVVLASVIHPRPVIAKDFPTRPIRLVVPFAPGGGTDACGRVIAEHLSKRLGQNVVVDNKPGAAGNIGTQAVARAEADGYTLLLAFDGTLVINPHVYEKVQFNTLRDFAPVGKVGDAALVLVTHPGSPVKKLLDVVAMSKAYPDGLSYGTAGIGGTPHIAGELLRLQTGANLTHVPYRGGGQAISDVIGDTLPLAFTAVAGAVPHVKSGKLYAIAISSSQRVASLPNVPTFVESGVADFDVSSWVGLAAPSKTPRAVIEVLNRELNAVLADPMVVERLIGLGITPTPGTPENFSVQIERDLYRYGRVVKAAGIRMD